MTDKQVISDIKDTLSNIETNFKGYKRRDSQMKLVNDIRNVLKLDRNSKILVAEAGTGIGKSFAYQLGGITHALNNGLKVVISTATVILQNQLIEKDIPLFQKSFPKKFSYAIAKGRGRYACRINIKNVANQKQDLLDGMSLDDDFIASSSDIDTANEMLAQLESGQWDGDIDKWSSKLHYKFKNAIKSDRITCTKSNKSHIGCPYHVARDELKDADVIVANHSLVLSNIAISNNSTLPSPTEAVYIFDEAHHLPSIARENNLESIVVSRLETIFQNLITNISENKLTPEGRGVAAHKSNMLSAANMSLVKSSTLFSNLASNIEPSNKEVRFEHGVVDTWLVKSLTELLEPVKLLKSALDKLIEELSESTTGDDDKTLFAALYFRQQVTPLRDAINALLTDCTEDKVIAKWAKHDGLFTGLFACNISSSTLLNEHLWKENEGVILTSATLCSLGNFERFREESGLINTDSAFYQTYSSTFNYQEQATLVIPKPELIPHEPNDPAHYQWIADTIDIHRKEEKSVLVLLTSNDNMNTLFDHLVKNVDLSNTLIQYQGESSREKIIERHNFALKKGKVSIILGLASMAEGLDLQRELLTCVIIPKLPFEPPTSPILKTQIEQAESQGKNSFFAILLPDSSTVLTQMVGRLIRTEEDTGHVVILDKRISTKRYGQQLISSLPPMRRE
ncbi:helicase C-terminal domain-containing protein [Vibrio barjaei]|uniref:helicase C-terminal domain-containing protein n=1 Tax=Vibrio barjaei TaxID=1676683 RepID=UPI00228386BA|nr:helicase C-terminal domain-containing protein [Vibrio barjaei]MCY9873829.1 hypothetical protein [Vibrio barjaei]